MEAKGDEIPKSIGNKLRFRNVQGAVENEPRFGNMQGIIGKKSRLGNMQGNKLRLGSAKSFGNMSPCL